MKIRNLVSKRGKLKLYGNVLLGFLILSFISLPTLVMKDSDFSGSDDEAGKVISQLHPDYHPWFSLPWAAPGKAAENLLFTLQATLGGSVLGFGLGYMHGRKKGGNDKNDKSQ